MTPKNRKHCPNYLLKVLQAGTSEATFEAHRIPAQQQSSIWGVCDLAEWVLERLGPSSLYEQCCCIGFLWNVHNKSMEMRPKTRVKESLVSPSSQFSAPLLQPLAPSSKRAFFFQYLTILDDQRQKCSSCSSSEKIVRDKTWTKHVCSFHWRYP